MALQDFIILGETFGLTLQLADDQRELTGNAIVIGAPERNRLTAEWVKQGNIKLIGITEPQGYEIVTMPSAGGKVIIIAGGSLIGEVYGIYWLWDRLRVYKTLPEINTKRAKEQNAERHSRNCAGTIHWIIKLFMTM